MAAMTRTDPAADLRSQLKALVEERERAEDDEVPDLTERIVALQAEIRRRFKP